MPTIMEQPYPMEFMDRGQTILLRLEEYDTTRTIHLDAEPAEPVVLEKYWLWLPDIRVEPHACAVAE